MMVRTYTHLHRLVCVASLVIGIHVLYLGYLPRISSAVSDEMTLADKIRGKRVMVGYTLTRGEDESLDYGRKILCDTLEEKLSVTCVNIFMGEGRDTLAKAGIDPKEMREAWAEFSLAGKDNQVYLKGRELLQVDFTLRNRGSSVGPAFLRFYWESWFKLRLYDAFVPKKLYAEVDAVGGGWGWRSKSAWRKAHKDAALDFVDQLKGIRPQS